MENFEKERKLDWDVRFFFCFELFFSQKNTETFFLTYIRHPFQFRTDQKNSGSDLDLFPQAWRSLRRERLIGVSSFLDFLGNKNLEHVHGDMVKFIDFNTSGIVRKV